MDLTKFDLKSFINEFDYFINYHNYQSIIDGIFKRQIENNDKYTIIENTLCKDKIKQVISGEDLHGFVNPYTFEYYSEKTQNFVFYNSDKNDLEIIKSFEEYKRKIFILLQKHIDNIFNASHNLNKLLKMYFIYMEPQRLIQTTLSSSKQKDDYNNSTTKTISKNTIQLSFHFHNSYNASYNIDNSYLSLHFRNDQKETSIAKYNENFDFMFDPDWGYPKTKTNMLLTTDITEESFKNEYIKQLKSTMFLKLINDNYLYLEKNDMCCFIPFENNDSIILYKEDRNYMEEFKIGILHHKSGENFSYDEYYKKTVVKRPSKKVVIKTKQEVMDMVIEKMNEYISEKFKIINENKRVNKELNILN